jgi:ankyrin repeat protein
LNKAIQVLIKLGIDKDAKDNEGWNALHFLCANSSSPHLIEAIQELIKLGIDKDAKTSYFFGWSALDLCRRNNYLKNFNVDEIFKNV